MEWAKLFPGHAKAISKEGAVYLDDFEGTTTPVNLKSFVGWSLASTPQGNELFPEGDLINDLAYGYNRARLSWYVIDPFMQRNTAPSYMLQENLLDDHRVREVFQAEIFPNKENPVGQPTNIPTLDLAFYPQERGPTPAKVNAQQQLFVLITQLAGISLPYKQQLPAAEK